MNLNSVDDILVKNLHISFLQGKNRLKIIDGIDICFPHEHFIGIIGKSGCGKSVLGQSILGILPHNTALEGQILYQGKDIAQGVETIKSISDFYGGEFGVIPQNPSESLSPVRRIYRQMQDILTVRAIQDTKHDLKRRLLQFFGLKDCDRILSAYTHELSGGMQQRVLCAMSISTAPKWILADEPTKGLDEQTCAVVYENLLKIKSQRKSSMLLITHDLNLAKAVCDKIAVMYAGQIVEYGDAVLDEPKHPYTKAFLAALPENGFHLMQKYSDSKNMSNSASDCHCKFAAYCKYATECCWQKMPDTYDAAGTKVRCFLYAER